MKQDLNLKKYLTKITGAGPKLAKHLPFAVILLVLLIYGLTIWRVSQLTTAEPTPEAQSSALTSSNPPKVDPKAIQQIQNLEQNSPQVHSLFNAARNNPFSE